MVPVLGRYAASVQPKVGALIRARRRRLHLTLQELCDAAGISVGYLSQVERDHATPSLGTLAQIARGLDVGVDYFIATPSMEDGLTRSAERDRFSVDGSSIIYERLAADFTGNGLVLVHPQRAARLPLRDRQPRGRGNSLCAGRCDHPVAPRWPGDGAVVRRQPAFLSRQGARTPGPTTPTRSTRLLWTGTLPMFRSRAERPPWRSLRADADTEKITHQKENTE